MVRQQNSFDSLSEATRSQARFSGHGNAKGAAGCQERGSARIECDFLDGAAQSLSVNRPPEGFADIGIGLAWDRMVVRGKAFFGLIKTRRFRNVDLDLGCLYEMSDGTRGSVQPFGEHFGSLERPPYIRLSGDERTGAAEGDDEYMVIRGAHWGEIKRVLLYVYIYDGVPDWSQLKPQIHVRVPGCNPMIVTLSSHRSELDICALALLENVRGGFKLTSLAEYYPGQEEMDRAFGFGLNWEEGRKAPPKAG